ncbi:hypothetical protein [Chromobacterium violaceum]|uniref:hypothetical protein n=1 Tax=Chromobacterium violaceum TaxID=536 RepID=UPI000AC0E5CA|nr:hypothetical protein [Chromobacterium violaceum]
MLYSISDDLIQNFLNGNCQDDMEAFFFRLLDARKRGRILLYGKLSLLLQLRAYYEGKGRSFEVGVLSKVISKLRQKNNLLKSLSIFVHFVNIDRCVRKIGRVIVMGYRETEFRDILSPPIFLAENMNDCKYYADIVAKYYLNGEENGLSGVKIHSGSYRGGGGNTVCQEYGYIRSGGNSLCFCISDSDKKYPNGAIGDTARAIQKIEQSSRAVLCSSYIIDCYSIENIIPISLLKEEYSKGKSAVDIDKFLIIEKLHSTQGWRYLPLKKGINGGDLKRLNGYSSFWNDTLTEVEVTERCCQEDACACEVIPKISDKTLVKIVERMDVNWSDVINLRRNETVDDIYGEVMACIKSWLCVGDPIRT